MDDGVFVNEEYWQDIVQRGYFTYGPKITLPRGIYYISVDYETNTYPADGDRGNFVECSGGNSYFHDLEYDKIMLRAGGSQAVFTLNARKNIENFQIMTVYAGYGDLKVEKILISQSKKTYAYNFFSILLFSLCIDFIIIVLGKIKEGKINFDVIWLWASLFGIVLFASYPNFVDFLLFGDDMNFHLIRIEGLKDALSAGIFPAKIYPSPANGYGAATGVFYGDLLLYFPAFLRIIGVSVQKAYAAYVVFVNGLTVLISYWSFHRIFHNKKAALFGTMLYTLSIYRLICIYHRTAVGEYTAMIFLPLVILGFYEIFQNEIKKDAWIVLTLGFTGLIQTHVLSCEMVAIAGILVFLVQIRKLFCKKRIWMLVKTGIMTCLLNAGFLVPFLDYYLGQICKISNGKMIDYDIQVRGNYLASLFTVFPNAIGYVYQKGTEASFRGMYQEASVNCGFILLFLAAVYLVFCLCRQNTEFHNLGNTAWIVSICMICFTLVDFPWREINVALNNLFSSIQFSWRFTGIVCAGIAVVAQCLFFNIEKYYGKNIRNIYVALTACCCVLLSGYAMGTLLREWEPYTARSQYVLPMGGIGTSYDEYLPYESDTIHSEYSEERTSSELLITSGLHRDALSAELNVQNLSGQEEYIDFPLYYYPGYRVNDERLICAEGEDACVNVTVPAGYEGTIKVWFETPRSWIIGYVVAAFAMVYLLATVILSGIKQYRADCPKSE